jgi:hypothetical protein
MSVSDTEFRYVQKTLPPKKTQQTRKNTAKFLQQTLHDRLPGAHKHEAVGMAAVLESHLFEHAPMNCEPVYLQLVREAAATLQQTDFSGLVDGQSMLRLLHGVLKTCTAPPPFQDKEAIAAQRLLAIQSLAEGEQRQCVKCQGRVVTVTKQLRLGADEGKSVIHVCTNPDCRFEEVFV